MRCVRLASLSAAALLGAAQSSSLLVGALAAVAVVAVTLINAAGSGSVGTIELVVVAVKLSILAVFVVGGASGIELQWARDR